MRRTMPARTAAVFAAFTDPDRLRQWWGPKGFTVPKIDFPARPGSVYRIEMQPPGGDAFHLTGEFREVEPPGRLAFTFVWDPADADDIETLVELSFRDAGDSTDVDYRQGPFKTEERRELHRGGWTDSFDRLEEFLRA